MGLFDSVSILHQIVYLLIILLLGSIILFIRRKAGASKSGYKLLLVFLGIILGSAMFYDTKIFSFDTIFLKTINVALLVTLLFELSVRLNPENIRFTPKNLVMFFTFIFANILILGLVAVYLLHVDIMHAIIFAIIMSSVEYFMVDQLKEEGDLANPLIIFFAFSILVFYTLPSNVFENTVYFLKYILIGLGTGIFFGIIAFKSMKNKYLDLAHELGMIAIALFLYIITEQLSGSGLFAVMIFGVFFGNSFVRKISRMHSFSPMIFKSLEILIYLMIGFSIPIMFNFEIVWKSLIVFVVYLIIRFVILHFVFNHFSIENKILLSFAPKGMILSVMILVLGIFSTVETKLLNMMLLVLVYSLIFGVILEYFEHRKVLRLDKLYKALLTIRFGRKSNLPNKKRWHIYYK